MNKRTSKTNFRKTETIKWQQWEIRFLTNLLESKDSISPTAWNDLQEMMQARGSRRTLKEYKDKYRRLLEKQTLKCQDLRAIKYRVYKQFQEGKNSQDILRELDNKNIKKSKINNILVEKFSSIKTHLKKIVGVSNVRQITLQDYELFRFIKEENLQIISFRRFQELIELLTKANRQKNDQQIKLIKTQLKSYNQNLHLYHESFQWSRQNSMHYNLIPQGIQTKSNKSLRSNIQAIQFSQKDLSKNDNLSCDKNVKKSKLSLICKSFHELDDFDHQSSQKQAFQQPSPNKFNFRQNNPLQNLQTPSSFEASNNAFLNIFQTKSLKNRLNFDYSPESNYSGNFLNREESYENRCLFSVLEP